MNWKVRHQGSPKSVENVTLEQIVEGLQDGLWETTDEVMGPGDSEWVAIEMHPQLADAAAEIEPPPPRRDPDESRLDMTPLIDVCLVLLIFMILTISYAAIQKELEAAQVSANDKPGKLTTVTADKVRETMIVVKATLENDVPVIHVEDETVPEERLTPALQRFASETHKVELLILPGPGIRRKTIVAIQDAASAAHITKIHVLAPKDLLPSVPTPPPLTPTPPSP
jgi:biopolymer transport protein ExbD